MASPELQATRLLKIQENRQKLQALGVQDAAHKALNSGERTKVKKRASKRKSAPATALVERRTSQRTKNVRIHYNEDQNDHLLRDLPRKGKGGRRGYSGARELGEEDAYHARLNAGIVLEGDYLCGGSSSSARKRGPQDSGRGVRVMGGKVYDSKYGVTCHWCRQKTLSEHVTCTAESCSVRHMPVSFCKSCLRNRHGEDWKQARDSGRWICPPCRGTCGAGCRSCCNCGPCRKKAGLEPTGQVKHLAIADGFSNVHDWLVHQETGESAAAILLRKLESPWGAWLTGGSSAKQEENPNASDCVDTENRIDACPVKDPEGINVATPEKEGPGALGETSAGAPHRKQARSRGNASKITKTAGSSVDQSVEGVSMPAAASLDGALEPCSLPLESSENEAACNLLQVGTACPEVMYATATYGNDQLKKVPMRIGRMRGRHRAH